MKLIALLIATCLLTVGCGGDDDSVGSGPDLAIDQQPGVDAGDGATTDDDDTTGDHEDDGVGAPSLRALEERLCSTITDDEVAQAASVEITESGYPGPNECQWGTGDVSVRGVMVRVVPVQSYAEHTARQRENANLTVVDDEVAGEPVTIVTTSAYAAVLVGPEGDDGAVLEIRALEQEQAVAVAEIVVPRVQALLAG